MAAAPRGSHREIVLVAGSYEGQLVGFSIATSSLGSSAAAPAAATPLFAFKAHDGCIRAAAAAADHLVTGSTDNTLGVYNLRKRRAHGSLLQEGGGGAISALSFYGGTHLLSGGGDGDVCIWRTSDWECLLRMKGHSAPIEALAVHPSGRLALSVCAGHKLRLWNLQTGKCNYTSALPQPTRVLLWTPRGDAYVTAAGSALRLHALGGEAAPVEMLHERPPAAAAFASEDVLASGGASGAIELWDAGSGERLSQVAAAHASRIKCLVSTFRSCGGGGAHLSSASTDGSIRLWRLVAAGASEPPRLESLLLLRTSLRLTALCASLVSHQACDSRSLV